MEEAVVGVAIGVEEGAGDAPPTDLLLQILIIIDHTSGSEIPLPGRNE